MRNYENQIEHLLREHANLSDELQKKASSSIETIDVECQTDDHQHDKLLQVNNKLKRALQTFKDKIQRLVVAQPDIFTNVGDETSERLDHLISTVEHQRTQMNILQDEHASVLAMYEQQLQSLIQERDTLMQQQLPPPEEK